MVPNFSGLSRALLPCSVIVMAFQTKEIVSFANFVRAIPFNRVRGMTGKFKTYVRRGV